MPSSAVAVERLQDALPGWTLKRALFDQGRLVLEREGELLVLEAGDSIPARVDASPLKTRDRLSSVGSLRVLEISDRRAVLAGGRVAALEGGGDGSALMPETLVLIDRSPDGTLSLTVGTAREMAEPLPPIDLQGGVLTVGPDGNSKAQSLGELRSEAPPAAPMYRVDSSGDEGSDEGGSNR